MDYIALLSVKKLDISFATLTYGVATGHLAGAALRIASVDTGAKDGAGAAGFLVIGERTQGASILALPTGNAWRIAVATKTGGP